MFEVLPAIDVRSGTLTHLTPDGPITLDAFGGNPLAAATAMVEAGARWLHVVDMDLAFSRSAANLGVIEQIAALPVSVQAAGGVRTAEEVRALRDAGAARVVLGSAALADPGATAELVTSNGDRLVIGLELEDGRIRSRGREPVDLDLMETLGWLVAAGAPAFLVTAVARVGSGIGPDVGAVRRVVRAGRPVLAAGGIRDTADLRALRAAGAVGAVVGRAALEGTLDLAAAFAERA